MREAEAEPIAVIGVYARTPGAGDDVDAFWRLVVEGRDALTALTDAQLTAAGVDADTRSRSDYVTRRGVLADVGQFDAEAFGMPPREAELTDPQHRLLLEAAWVLLERAGHGTATAGKRVGVLAGAGPNHYLLRHVLADPSIEAVEGLLPLVVANDRDHLAAKIAYRLGLTGPALTVQTACSTSLVAVHQGVRTLRARDADLVLAGGVSVELPQEEGYAFTPGSVLSRTGHCRPFQTGRDGSVPGNGLGLVALRRLEDAIADRDTVLAVIRGSAVNNDGGDKAGYTAPGFSGQVDVLRLAYQDAGIDPATVGYLEGHGTGTEVGDDIELAALDEVFARGRTDEPLPLGSVKANVGNPGAAAGVIGLIKTVLAVHHGVLPPMPGAGDEGAADDLPTGFTLDPVARPWVPAPGVPRRAGVSSYGIGGTNSHVVVEEYRPSDPAPREDLAAAVIPLSATGEEGVLRYRDALAEQLAARPGWRVGDIARTFTSSRRVFPVRLGAVITPDGLVRASLQEAPRHAPRKARPIVLAFGEQETAVPGTLAGLHPRYAVVRERVAEILGKLPEEECARVRSVLLDGADDPAAVPGDLLRLSLYITQVAVAELLGSLGVAPVAVLGHGLGEFAAACLAGEFSVVEGARLVRERARLTDEGPPGESGEAARLFVDFADADAFKLPGRGADQWAARLGQPVCFPDAMRTLAEKVPGALVLELGPGEPLGALLRSHILEDGPAEVLPVLPGTDLVSFLTQLGQLWSAGIGVDLGLANGAEDFRRVPLPTYPFDRRRHWIGAPRTGLEATPAATPREEAGTLPAVLRAWEETLGYPDIEPDADLYMLGGDSLTLVRLAGRLAEVFGLEITAMNLLNTDLTPHAMAELIDAMTAATREGAK
ncbi:beta-ketoacyl synthase N-terminal-like domain-containing protein [Streptomyces sp. NPDC094038]|uniref:beta-ketoacyl synthase N-terminal-like domain-containing protein n=1 Tax=Streptomyces sp. NPDC094038 TaxID=3366055 RepID=UPI0038174D07